MRLLPFHYCFLAVAVTVAWFGGIISRHYDWMANNGRPASEKPFASSRHLKKQQNQHPNLDDIPITKYQANMDDAKVLNVHIVAHTHDDVGWLKTVEEYYYGLNMTIQDACVRDILDTVVTSLLAHPNRTFVYVESKFFSLWWSEQSDSVKDAVRFLIANHQLTFVNGGWCMHDEASTHFMGMLDQTTLGHDFLKKELGVVPTVGWQLDPFGHSATQASLMTARLGFDALYFGRIDYQDLQLRHETAECEGLWQASPSAPTDTVFWGLTGSYSGNYEAPSGFCFDVRCHNVTLPTDLTRDQLVLDVKKFLEEIKLQANRTKGNHIMLTFGSDFNYQRAEQNFANIDLLMKSVKLFQHWGLIDLPSILGPEYQDIHLFYSSPNYYTKMKHEEQTKTKLAAHHGNNNNNTNNKNGEIDWAVKTDDFFPYSDCPHCFWTGYFTSRAAFKRLERVGSSFLMAARQIEAMPQPNQTNHDNNNPQCCSHHHCDCDHPLYQLEDALGVAQHHDAVSGTAKQHVANDYSKRVQAGINQAADFVATKLRTLLSNNTGDLKNLAYCQRLNETICEVSQQATTDDVVRDTELYVVVYNPLSSSNRSTIVRLPVSTDKAFDVTRIDTVASATTVHPINSPFEGARQQGAKYVLLFDTGPLPPLGMAVFRITQSPRSELSGFSSKRTVLTSRYLRSSDNNPDSIVASNELIDVMFDRQTGAMQSIASGEAKLDVSQDWGYYTSFDATINKPTDNSKRNKQNSGAYVFRPSEPSQNLHIMPYKNGAARFESTTVGVEVHASFEKPWISQVTRILKNQPFVEIEYSVGPIPIDDGIGKEIVTRLTTPIQCNGTFYTDSNAREFLKRRRDFRPSWDMEVFEPVAGNYYPVNAAICIEDEASSLAVVVDRTQGGGSIHDGTIELMAHRRMLADDDRGVGEPLNETDGGVTPYPPFGNATRWGNGLVIRGTYRILVGNGNSGVALARPEMDSAFASPMVFAASASKQESSAIKIPRFLLQTMLPANVMLITFKKLGDSLYLVRLAHQYGIHDDDLLSQPVSVDLSELFPGATLSKVEERTLSGNQRYNDWLKRRMEWRVEATSIAPSTVDVNNATITLEAMEIKTFWVAVK